MHHMFYRVGPSSVPAPMRRFAQRLLRDWNRKRLKNCLCIYFVLVVLYKSLEIVLLNVALFDLVSTTSGSAPRFEGGQNEIDAVYTWVNGTDPVMLKALHRTTNQITAKRLESACLSPAQWHKWCLPLVLVRPKLSDPDRHFESVLKYEHLNESISLIYLANSQIARSVGANCVRIIEGQIFKLTNLCLAMSGLPDLQLDTLVRLNNISAMPDFADGDPLKYFSAPTRKHFTLLDTLHNETSALYMSRQAEANLSRVVAFVRDKVETSAEYRFEVEWPVGVRMTDRHFFEHELHCESTRPNRFADNDELRYSLRSLERFAPWIRHVVIVTNGQMPHWLNVDHPKIRLVQHKDIFPDTSHLPSFSSAAIESHLHRIPGLSKRFLYFNDDILLGDHIYPDDFYTLSGGFKVYLSWPVPNCAAGCPLNWLNDGYCDKACNSSKCLWDGGDCLLQSRADSNSSVSEDHRSSVSIAQEESKLCAPNCLDSWLGDSFCDQVCNKPECAFDMADCGVHNFHSFGHVAVSGERNVYEYPANSSVVYLNFSNLLDSAGKNHHVQVQLNSARYANVTGVRAAALNLKHKILTVLFITGTIPQTLEITLSASVKQLAFNFTLWMVQNGTSLERNDSVMGDAFNLAKLLQQMQLDAQQVQKRPTPLQGPNTLVTEIATNISDCQVVLDSLPEQLRSKFELVEEQRKKGLLSERGQETFAQKLTQLYVDLVCKDQKRLESQAGSFVANYVARNSSSERSFTGRRLLDAYADSLIYVNHLYNGAFGVQARQVPAHMAHFVDVDIMSRLQRQFALNFQQTSASQLRNSEDMQFSFSYFYFLMSETEETSVEQLLIPFDTDQSSSLSANELKTLLIRLNGTPLKEEHLSNFVSDLNSCCNGCLVLSNHTTRVLSFEFELDVQLEQIANCTQISEKILAKWSTRRRNKFEIINDDTVAFKMLRSNESLLEQELNELRSKRKKFLCLNDNFEHNTNRTQVASLRRILREFYTSLFPARSSFEHHDDYHNKYLYIDSYYRWRQELTHKSQVYFNCSYFFLIINIILFIALIAQ